MGMAIHPPVNFDPQSSGEDADGLATKFESLGSGNVFRGTRAWSNSDDGYDFWHAATRRSRLRLSASKSRMSRTVP